MRTMLHLLPDLGPSGHAQQLALIAPRLPRDQFQIRVATFRDSDFFREPLCAANIPVFVLALHQAPMPILWIALLRLLAQQKPDAIHAWGWQALRLTAAATIGKRIPIIAGDTALSPRSGWFDRWCLGRAKRIALPTGVADERTTIIPYCAEAAPAIDRAAARKKLDLPAEVPVFLFAGALEPRHGWRDALEVFDILSHVYAGTWLLVAGNGPDAAASDEYRVKLGLQNVRLLGWRSDLHELLSAADMLFVFGERGGRNLALQALAAGTPVAAWRRPDLVQMLGDAALFCDRGDRHSVAIAIRRIVENPADREALITRGKAQAEQFSPEKIVPQWAELYRRI